VTLDTSSNGKEIYSDGERFGKVAELAKDQRTDLKTVPGIYINFDYFKTY